MTYFRVYFLLKETYGDDCLDVIAEHCLGYDIDLGRELADSWKRGRYNALGKERKRAQRGQRAASIDQFGHEVQSTDNWVETIEMAIDIKHAIGQLRPIDQQICRLLAEGRSLPEIGTELNLTHNQVKIRKEKIL